MQQNEQNKAVPDFRHGEMFTVIGKYFTQLKLRHFFTPNISKNRHIKYIENTYIVLPYIKNI